MRVLSAALSALALAVTPVAAQTTLNLTGDNSNGSPGQVLLSGFFKADVFPFAMSADGDLTVTLNATTVTQPVFAVYNIPFTDFDPLTDGLAFDQAFALGGGPITFFVTKGDYTGGVVENFPLDPGGTFDITFSGDALVLPTVDTPLLLTEVALETARARHAGLPNTVSRAIVARGQAARSDGTASAHIATLNGTVTGRYHLWADLGGGGSDSKSSGLSVRYAEAQVGLDYALTENIAAGVAIGGGRFGVNSGTSKIDGYSYWVQPYVGAKFGALSATASVAVARDEYSNIRVFGLTGDASGYTFSGNLHVAWDQLMSDGWFLTPYAEVSAGRQRVSETSVMGMTTGSRDFFEAAAGLEFRHEFDWGKGPSLFYVRAEGRQTFGEAPTPVFGFNSYDSTRFGLGFATGASIMVADHLSLGGEARVDGLGSDVTSFAGLMTVKLGF